MDDSTGNKLKKAREAQKLTVEDVARATKIRPAQIRDLEEEEYSNFANLTYARSYLKLYANYLKVDVSQTLASFGDGHSVTSDDYQYLHRNPVARTKAVPARRPGFSMAWLRTGIIVVVVALAGFFLFQLARDIQRLGPAPGSGPLTEEVDDLLVEGPEEEPVTEEESVSEADTMARHGPGDRAPPDPLEWPLDTVPFVEPREGEEAQPAIRRAEAARPVFEPGADFIATGYQVTIRPVRRTWVTVTRNNPNAPPYYDAFLTPESEPLEFEASQAWIAVDDPEAVEIFKNGERIAASMEVFID